MAIYPTLDGPWWCWELHTSCWIVRLWEMMICPDDFMFVRKRHVMGDLDDGLDVGRSVWSCYRSSFPTASPWMFSTQSSMTRHCGHCDGGNLSTGRTRGCHLMKLKCWLRSPLWSGIWSPPNSTAKGCQSMPIPPSGWYPLWSGGLLYQYGKGYQPTGFHGLDL